MDELDKKLDELIQKMRSRIYDEGIETKKLAEIIQIALGMSGASYKALLDSKISPERIEFALKSYLDCVRIIIEANWKANKMLNPNIEMPSIEEQFQEEMQKQQNKKLQRLYPQYF